MFLGGAGAATLSIPFLGSLAGRAEAMPATPRIKRAVFIGLNYGSWREKWFPSDAARTALTRVSPRAQTMPLAAFTGDLSPVFTREVVGDVLDKMIFLDGIDGPYGIGHEKTYALTGHKVESAALLTAPSIDQIIADRALIYDSEPAFRSFNVAAGTGTHHGPSISYADVGGVIQPVPQLTDPSAVWDAVFSSVALGDDPASRAEAERRRALRLSVVDGVLSDYQSLRSSTRLSATDRRRLDGYLDYLRDYERSIAERETVVCAAPPRPDSSTYPRSPSMYPEVLAPDMATNIVHMLRCGLTNVVSFNIEPTAREYAFLPGVTGDHHGISHGIEELEGIDRVSPQIEQIDRFHARVIAGLVRGLDVEDPATGRSMLDDTVVFVGNNMGSVLNHKGARMPCLMFGGGSVLRTGNLVDFRSEHSWSYVGGFERIERMGIAYNHLLVMMCQLFGLQPEDYEHGQEGIGEYVASSYYYRGFGTGSRAEQQVAYEAYAFGDKRAPLSELLV
jgi:hypothetical protein